MSVARSQSFDSPLSSDPTTEEVQKEKDELREDEARNVDQGLEFQRRLAVPIVIITILTLAMMAIFAI